MPPTWIVAPCPACEIVRQNAKAAGHRGWRTDFVCWDHAAFDLNSPEGRALFASAEPAAVTRQPDLFGGAA